MNRALAICSTVGGGSNNATCSSYAVIAGGHNNTVTSITGTIGGGFTNTASGTYDATVSGGALNTASGNKSTVAGGQCNTASGGVSFAVGCGNTASGFASLAAGRANTVSGDYSAAIGCGLTASSARYLYANNICNVSGGTSDCRMKHSICPLTYSLDTLTQLQPVSFVFNGDCSNFRRYGFIAQQVYQVVPEIITHHPIDKIDAQGNVGGEIEGEPILQFEKDAVYAGYVNALKELKERVEALETEVQALKNK
jgi:hypothetical protein